MDEYGFGSRGPGVQLLQLGLSRAGYQPGLSARLALLELMFNTSVTGNPFTVTFETLDGTVVEGVWNTTAKRIEF